MTKQQAVQVLGFDDECKIRDDLLVVREIDVPAPGRGQYLVRIVVRPVNPSDVGRINGGFGRKETPFVPGLEGVGRIEEAGPGASKFPVGTRVIALGWVGGTWQQFTLADEDKLVPVPDSISDKAACQFVVNPCTAFGMMDDLAVPKGEWLLQSAAGSVLGRMVIAIAKAQGIKTLNLVRRSQQRQELLDLGADAVVATDQADWKEQARKVVGDDGAYGALDAVGGSLTGDVMELTRREGTTLLYGALAGQTASAPILPWLFGVRKIVGWTLFSWLPRQGARVPERMAEVWKLYEEGVIDPYTGESLPLSRALEGLHASLAVGRGGKVLLEG